MDRLDPRQLHEQAQSLEQRLNQPSAFREESCDNPLVYGYIRVSSRRPSYVRACRRVLVRYCEAERLRLCGLFADQETAADRVPRPGLAGLCDVLRLPDSFAAVVVDAGHLSTNQTVAALLAQQIRATGARLLVVRPGTGSRSDGRAGARACLPLPPWWQ